MHQAACSTYLWGVWAAVWSGSGSSYVLWCPMRPSPLRVKVDLVASTEVKHARGELLLLPQPEKSVKKFPPRGKTAEVSLCHALIRMWQLGSVTSRNFWRKWWGERGLQIFCFSRGELRVARRHFAVATPVAKNSKRRPVYQMHTCTLHGLCL